MDKRIEQICNSVGSFSSEVKALAESVLFMEQKLEETQKLIEDEPLVIEYDNGGGQCGIRENPSFVAYEKLFASYSKGITALLKIIKEYGNEDSSITSFEERRARLRLAR